MGGPSNSIIRNGGASQRGYAPEKRITLVEGEGRERGVRGKSKGLERVERRERGVRTEEGKGTMVVA